MIGTASSRTLRVNRRWLMLAWGLSAQIFVSCSFSYDKRFSDGGTDTDTDTDADADADADADTDSDTDADTDTACADACEPSEVSCDTDGNALSCDDHDSDSCLEFGVKSDCAEFCYLGACVDCVADEDCPEPVRQWCDSDHACQERAQWADVIVSYNGGEREQALDRMHFAVAEYHVSDDDYVSALFQQDGGWTVWTLTVHLDADVGSQPLSTAYPQGSSVVLTASNAELPSQLQGTYLTTGGTVDYDALVLEPGGVVSGTVAAELKGGNDSDELATLTGTFYAEIEE